MGSAQRDAEKFRGAEQNLTRALSLYRAGDDAAGAVIALNNLGELQLATARVADAHTSHAQALAALGDIESPAETARALEGSGRCHLSTGETAAAAEFLRQAGDIYASLGSPKADRIDVLLRDHGL